MKLFSLALILSFSVSSFAFASKAVLIGVNGMVCGFCAQGISKKFSADPAVEKVKVNLENKVVSLNLKPDHDIADETIKSILTESGYSVSKIERK
jgi:copper chaperone CopZ